VTPKLRPSAERQISRAKNAVAQFLFRQLIVPKIFVEARWPDSNHRVDVMAVDRSGAGDVHVVEVMSGSKSASSVNRAAASIMKVPAHFRYVALFPSEGYSWDGRLLYAPDGIGRVGLIRVTEDDAGNLAAEFLVRPERFRFEGSFKSVDKFTATHSAFIEIRP